MQKNGKQIKFVWLDLMFTLAALGVMQYFYYGVRAVVLSGVCMISSVIAEIVSLRLMNRKFTSENLTCVSDALIISLMVPAVIDFKVAAISCIFATVVAKNIFGGQKEMIFSPSAAAYVFMLTSWKSQIIMYTEPHVHTGIFEKAGNLVSSASHVFNTTGKMDSTGFEILMGNVAGSAGTVSILLLAVAAAILLLRKDISFGAFVGTISATALFSYVAPMCRDRIDSVGYTLSTNMILFAAIYIISDVRLAPKDNLYSFAYGFMIAMFSYIIMFTTAKENVIVIMSLLSAPVMLVFRGFDKMSETTGKEGTEVETKKISS